MPMDCFRLTFCTCLDILLDILLDARPCIMALDQIQCLLYSPVTCARTVMEKVQDLMAYSLLGRDVNALVTKQESITRYGETLVLEGPAFRMRSRPCLLSHIRGNIITAEGTQLKRRCGAGPLSVLRLFVTLRPVERGDNSLTKGIELLSLPYQLS